MKFDFPPKKKDDDEKPKGSLARKILVGGLSLTTFMPAGAKGEDNSLSNLDLTNKENRVGGEIKLERDSLIKEYGEVMADRWTDFKILNKKADNGKTYRQIFNEIGKEYAIAPEILFASTAEEGLRSYIAQPFDTKDKEYPVSGFENFGLDRFTEMFPLLVKSGLLESNFLFKQSLHKNEKGMPVKSANFKSVEDAIRAKAAMMTYVSDKIVDFVDKNNIALSDNALDFFMLVAYNAGLSNATKMISDYNGVGALNGDIFLKNRPTKGNEKVTLNEESWNQPFTYAMRRFIPADAWKDKGVLKENRVKKIGADFTKKSNTIGLPGTDLAKNK